MILGFITIAMLQNLAVSAGTAAVTGMISVGIKWLLKKVGTNKEEEKKDK